MNKKILMIAIIPVIGFIVFDWITSLSDEKENPDEIIFHITGSRSLVARKLKKYIIKN